MIYDKWRTGRSAQYLEKNDEPSMVEPCYNPSIRDYLMNPSLVARKGLYDEGEDIDDDLPDNWSDEPIYSELPARAEPAQKAGKKGRRQPATSDDANDGSSEAKDDEGTEEDDNDDLPFRSVGRSEAGKPDGTQ